MTQLYPFTDPIAAIETPPKMMVSGEGCTITDADGKTYLDGVAGLWCASLGFTNPRLKEAATRQMEQLGFYHSFMGRTSNVAERLAEVLGSKLPGDVNHVFFGCSGSDAVETASKIARFYWHGKGQPDRVRMIARESAYHGSLQTSATLTGMGYCHEGFAMPLDTVLRTAVPYYSRNAEPGESEIAYSKRLVKQLADQIDKADPATIGAFIGEPAIGSGGLIPPPDGYWDEVQNLLSRHGILLIADEIITGFGRTGEWFACETFGIQPDLMTMAKQLTSAMFPVSAVGMTDAVYETISSNAHTMKTFGHGLTYGGHPVGCAVALETLAIYDEMDLPTHVKTLGAHLGEKLASVRDHAIVADLRHVGLMAAVELKEGITAASVIAAMEDAGVILRGLPNNSIAISPPYVITPAEIDRIVDVLIQHLDQAALADRAA